MSDRPTIYALSSGAGVAGVAVLRISGPGARDALRVMTGNLPPPRTARRVRISDPVDRRHLDDGLALYFPGPHSYSGEDVVELHVHGGRAVVGAVLAALGRLPGFRLAEPGEFTRRAFLAGKLDLTEAEGLADLIAAETEAQRRQALEVAGGALARLYGDWRHRLIAAMALVEAGLDFADEADVSEGTLAEARPQVQGLLAEIHAHLDDGRRGEILREGLVVVLAGPPNAGKSSLLNALARRDVAIVSPEPGTTRDIIEARLDLGGFPVLVSDTAGLREGGGVGAVEQEGVRRALERASRADLVLWLIDPLSPVIEPPAGLGASAKVIAVVGKADLVREVRGLGALPKAAHRVSCRTGDGLPGLIELLTAEARARLQGAAAGAPTLIRHRQRVLLEAAASSLARFISGDAVEAELRAEDLRSAATVLGRLTGRIDAEDVLDQVFGSFCIGK